MHRTLIISASLLAGAVHAEDCSELKLSNDYLTEHFCNQLKSLGQPASQSRNILGDEAARDAVVLPEWAEIGLIQDAYRADPRKTLELIKRIKSAGGLAGD